MHILLYFVPFFSKYQNIQQGTFGNKMSWSITSTESRNMCHNSVSDLYWTPADWNFFYLLFIWKWQKRALEHHQRDFFTRLLWTCYFSMVTCFHFGNIFSVYLLTHPWWSLNGRIKTCFSIQRIVWKASTLS